MRKGLNSYQQVSFLETYIGTDGWQCCYIQGRWSYLWPNKQGKKDVPYGELVGITECIML